MSSYTPIRYYIQELDFNVPLSAGREQHKVIPFVQKEYSFVSYSNAVENLRRIYDDIRNNNQIGKLHGGYTYIRPKNADELRALVRIDKSVGYACEESLYNANPTKISFGFDIHPNKGPLQLTLELSETYYTFEKITYEFTTTDINGTATKHVFYESKKCEDEVKFIKGNSIVQNTFVKISRIEIKSSILLVRGQINDRDIKVFCENDDSQSSILNIDGEEYETPPGYMHPGEVNVPTPAPAPSPFVQMAQGITPAPPQNTVPVLLMPDQVEELISVITTAKSEPLNTTLKVLSQPSLTDAVDQFTNFSKFLKENMDATRANRSSDEKINSIKTRKAYLDKKLAAKLSVFDKAKAAIATHPGEIDEDAFTIPLQGIKALKKYINKIVHDLEQLNKMNDMILRLERQKEQAEKTLSEDITAAFDQAKNKSTELVKNNPEDLDLLADESESGIQELNEYLLTIPESL